MTGREFDPDWCIAPAATLKEWMGERDIDTPNLAFEMARIVVPIPGGGQDRQTYQRAIEDVLAKQPMPGWFPHMMAALSGTSQLFWRNLESNYRDGLARGLTDVTFGGE
jgi:hypothetical protein